MSIVVTEGRRSPMAGATAELNSEDSKITIVILKFDID